MSQMGMQMPGGMRRRGPSLDVYTALMAAAVVALAAACFIVFLASSKIGKDGGAFPPMNLQEPGKIVLPKAG